MRGSGEWMGLAVPPHQKGPQNTSSQQVAKPRGCELEWRFSML